MKAPLPVQAINNEFEVLASFLGIADDNDQERSQIKVLGIQNRIQTFQFKDEVFAVARKDMMTGVATAHEFNSNWYAIQKHVTGTTTQATCLPRLRKDRCK